ncbi:MAG: hypothetical protein WBG38_01575, partial [Nodosilinea sp.]
MGTWVIVNRFMLGSVALSLAGCVPLSVGQLTAPVETSQTSAAPDQTVLSAAAEAAPVPLAPDPFREAVNRATSAVAIGQSAQSKSDWQLAASRWQQAVALMEQVPTGSPNRVQAQIKVQEYGQHLAAAQRRASGPIAPAAAAPAPTAALPTGLAAQIPIQQRQGGTPVVAVTLQGSSGAQTFSMLFDT